MGKQLEGTIAVRWSVLKVVFQMLFKTIKIDTLKLWLLLFIKNYTCMF